MVCVRPGVLLVLAILLPTSELIRLDLPTLERPTKAISGAPGGGNCRGSAAEVTKRVRTFMPYYRRCDHKVQGTDLPAIAPVFRKAAWPQIIVRFNSMAVSELQSARIEKARSFSWLPAILAGVVLTLIAVGIAVWALAGLGLLQLTGSLRGGQVHINVDQPTVVRQIRALERLETVSYTMDKIVSGEREDPILPQFLAGDRLLLVVHGEAVAGVDLSKLQPADVTVRGNTVRIHLPPAEIFTTSLDNAKTKVYSRDTGLFSSPDPNLEGEVREAAEQQLRTASLDDSILKTADSNARQTITNILKTFGFANVEIN